MLPSMLRSALGWLYGLASGLIVLALLIPLLAVMPSAEGSRWAAYADGGEVLVVGLLTAGLWFQAALRLREPPRPAATTTTALRWLVVLSCALELLRWDGSLWPILLALGAPTALLHLLDRPRRGSISALGDPRGV